jgi:hypothetical protein
VAAAVKAAAVKAAAAKAAAAKAAAAEAAAAKAAAGGHNQRDAAIGNMCLLPPTLTLNLGFFCL